MWLISRLRDQRYCAFCKTLRRVYVKKHIDLTNVLAAIVFAATTTYAAFGEADPRCLVVFCLFLVVSEMVIHVRWRANVVCKMCGFDPILYKRSPAKASLAVKKFFQEQVENPEFWLTRSPLLSVQRRVRAQEKRALDQQIVLNRAKSSSLAPSKGL